MSRSLRAVAVAGTLAFGLTVGTAQALPFQNGSFEITSEDPGSSFLTKNPGNASIDGWVILGPGSIDHVGTYWQAADGTKSIDLNGTINPGNPDADQGSVIAQVFDTTPGATYTVTFALSGNPDGGDTIKAGAALALGDVFDEYDFEFNTIGHSRTDMGWEDHSFTFQAVDTQSVLFFASFEDGQFGPVIDNVRVAVPEPATLALLGVGLLGLGMIRRRKA